MKICIKCKKAKPLSGFYKHPQMKDGRLNKCKECSREDSTNHRNDNIDKIRGYDRERGKLSHRSKFSTKTTQRIRKQFPHIYKAQTIVNNTVRSGELVKPDICSACDKKGRQIEGHHDDYSKPLDIIWLCSACHKQLHRELKQV